MLKLNDFNDLKIANSSINKLKGGWSDVIVTATGTIVHSIDDCTGQELWIRNEGNNTYVGGDITDGGRDVG